VGIKEVRASGSAGLGPVPSATDNCAGRAHALAATSTQTIRRARITAT